MSRKKIFVVLDFKEDFLREVSQELLAYNDVKEVQVYANGLEIFYDSTNRQEWEVVAALERVIGRKGFPIKLSGEN